MAIPYARAVEFVVPAGAVVCVKLGMPPRGVLERLIIKQVDGSASAASFAVLSRSGASPHAVDVNAIPSGAIASIIAGYLYSEDSTSGDAGQAMIEFTTRHRLHYGDVIIVKSTGVGGYNVEHTVLEIVDEFTVITNVEYISDVSTGLWQITPWSPMLSREMYIVHEGTVTSGTTLKEFELNKSYENQDNQDRHIRTPNTALWLEFDPAGGGETAWEVAYTSQADSMTY